MTKGGGGVGRKVEGDAKIRKTPKSQGGPEFLETPPPPYSYTTAPNHRLEALNEVITSLSLIPPNLYASQSREFSHAAISIFKKPTGTYRRAFPGGGGGFVEFPTVKPKTKRKEKRF